MTVPADFHSAPSGHAGPGAASLLAARQLTVTYGRNQPSAVRDVALEVPRGQTLGLVGESGSGKTSVGLAILNLVAATGSVVFDGQEILGRRASQMRLLRRRMQMVFQNPAASLDPRMTVRRIIQMPIIAHGIAPRRDADDLIAGTLDKVSLPAAVMHRYPHQLSGGQRQRVAIARALVTTPDFIVCDEITSSLDVSVQAQVVNLLMDLQADLGLTLLFISHNLGIVRQVSGSIAVMYLGRVVESGPADQIYSSAAHPYTRALLEAVPSPDPEVEANRNRVYLQADPTATLATWSAGCVYAQRCPFATDLCHQAEPALTTATSAAHLAACHYSEQVLSGTASSSKDPG